LTCVLLAALAVPADDAVVHKTASGWFDLENCAFCRHYLDDPGLLDHVRFECHKITAGAVMVTMVDPGWATVLDRATAAMEDLGSRMMDGSVDPLGVKMCGHCMTLGQLRVAGAKVEVVDGDRADIVIITADDPEMVAMIHEFADRNAREQAELMAAVSPVGP
jgi:hypothetical protein